MTPRRRSMFSPLGSMFFQFVSVVLQPRSNRSGVPACWRISAVLALLMLSLLLPHPLPAESRGAPPTWDPTGAESLHVEILGHYPLANAWEIWDCAAYVDSAGHEYALVGGDSLYIFDLANPRTPLKLPSIPPQTDPADSNSKFVDVVVRGHYAYAAERMGPLLIVDLRDPGAAFVANKIPQHEFCACSQATLVGGRPRCIASVDTMKVEIETLLVDDRGFLYVAGLKHGEGMHVYDLAADPIDPPFRCNIHEGPASFYVREIHVYQDTVYMAASKGTPSRWKILAGEPCPGQPELCGSSTMTVITHFTHSDTDLHAHSQWPLRDLPVLLTCDEREDGHVRAWDLSQLPATPQQVGSFWPDGTCHSVHNVYSRSIPELGEVVYAAWYNKGIQVFLVRANPSGGTMPMIDRLGFYEHPIRWRDQPGDICCDPAIRAPCFGVPFMDVSLPSGVFIASEASGPGTGGLLVGRLTVDPSHVGEPHPSAQNVRAEGRLDVRMTPGTSEVLVLWWPGVRDRGSAKLLETQLDIFSAGGRAVANLAPVDEAMSEDLWWSARGDALEDERPVIYRWSGRDGSGRSLPSGVYFARPRGASGDRRSSGRIVLLAP